MFVNLRGVRESGRGVQRADVCVHRHDARTHRHRHRAAPARPHARRRDSPRAPRTCVRDRRRQFLAGFAFTFLLLRAFSGGCVAMTGTEAISNGVGAFKAPASRNAAMTLAWMATILGVFFLGISFLAQHLAVLPSTAETVLSQFGHRVFGTGSCTTRCSTRPSRSWCSPRIHRSPISRALGSILANRRYLPRQLVRAR